MITLREFEIVPVRRPKGKVAVRLAPKTDGDMFKDRAVWLLEALGAYYSHRAGFCLSPQRAEVFSKLYRAGWSASWRLMASDKEPCTFSPPDGETKHTLKEALVKIDEKDH